MLSVQKSYAIVVSSRFFFYEVLPVLAINVFAIISAIALCFAKNWSRILLIALSVIYVLVHIRAYLLAGFISAMAVVQALMSVFVIWHLTRPNVKDWISGIKNKV